MRGWAKKAGMLTPTKIHLCCRRHNHEAKIFHHRIRSPRSFTVLVHFKPFWTFSAFFPSPFPFSVSDGEGDTMGSSNRPKSTATGAAVQTIKIIMQITHREPLRPCSLHVLCFSSQKDINLQIKTVQILYAIPDWYQQKRAGWDIGGKKSDSVKNRNDFIIWLLLKAWGKMTQMEIILL